MFESKYCTWFFLQKEDTNRWLCESRCGEVRIVTRNTKFFKEMYSEGICPKCEKAMTVGELIR